MYLRSQVVWSKYKKCRPRVGYIFPASLQDWLSHVHTDILSRVMQKNASNGADSDDSAAAASSSDGADDDSDVSGNSDDGVI
jgi:hypothetical protein